MNQIIPGRPAFAPFAPWQPLEPAKIPRIHFAYSDCYAAGYVTQTIAPPKLGKSLLKLSEGVDAASGRGILSGRPSEPQNVLYYNAEDDQAILNARTVAALSVLEIEQREIVGRFTPVSGMDRARQLVLVQGEKASIQEDAFDFLAREIDRLRITIAIFDPLQDLSESPETNEVFRALGKRLRKLAGDTGAAIGIVHHTRKAMAGVAPTMDDGRGGGSLRGVARFNRLLVGMTEAEATQAGVDDCRRFFRIAEAESNLAPPSSDRNRWFEKIGVEIGNGGSYPAVRRWTWPETFAGITANDACRVRAAISERAAREEPVRESVQAKDWAGVVVAEVLGLDLGKPTDKARVKAMLKQWIEAKVLSVENLSHGPKSKVSPFIVPGPNNPMLVE